MSASIEMKEIPAWTILQVNLANHSVFIEAWAKEELEKKAFMNACGSLKEGDVVEVRFDKKQNAVIIQTRGTATKKEES